MFFNFFGNGLNLRFDEKFRKRMYGGGLVSG